jgi:NitT/TauT family transport system substrate-binding protein
VVLLGGGHIGCIEIFGNDRVRAIRDLKGKTVFVSALGNPAHIFFAIAMAHVGLDHRKDITLITRPPVEAIRLFEEGRLMLPSSRHRAQEPDSHEAGNASHPEGG